jgi:hypothetical protein
MRENALKSLREAPITVPALAAVALFAAWATDQGGYPLTHWSPGGLIVLVLLLMALWIVGLRAREIPGPVKLALACLTGYTAISYLSILWAAVPGDAWEGANRTLLYLLVFALFACWRQKGSTAALVLVCWVVAMIIIAAYTALHLDAASTTALHGSFPEGRLNYPTGYPNANAAQWLMAFWPALLLARSARLPAALRGFLAGGAVLLADLALLSQSRGSLYATPVMVVLVLALIPGRMRTLGVLVAVSLGAAAAAPSILRVGNHLTDGQVSPHLARTAIMVSFAAAVLIGSVVTILGLLEARVTVPERSRELLRRATRAVVVAVLVVGLVAALLAVGNPSTRINEAWSSFKGGYGSTAGTGGRLTSGLGSNRYDFYRVALNEAAAHPVLGIGVDNFQQQYLLHGRSQETPRYPHSLEIRTVTETGAMGAVLALVGLGAALLAGWRAMRSYDELGCAVAAAALAGFAYWVVHGSFDWFWEFAGLGAPAFAMLGLACALAPGRSEIDQSEPARAGAPGGKVLVGIATALALLCAASLTAPWLSELEVESAAKAWTRSPATAYARLHEAARLNPLSDRPYVVAGSIALRERELTRARAEFDAALKRAPADAYATLELGAIASASSEPKAALALIERAVRLNPRDAVAGRALTAVRDGLTISVAGLDRAILQTAEQIR